jgi:IclR family acetate operon transcriptional repressor
VRAVERAINVLRCVARSSEGIGVRELARVLNLRPSTASRILMALERMGLTRQDAPTGRYAMGPAILEIAAGYHGQRDFCRVARPHMETLCEQTGETVFLGVLDGLDVVIVNKVDSPRPLRMVSPVGSREPAWCTALGKVLLSELPEPQVRRRLGSARLRRLTSRSRVTPASLARALAGVRAAGVALDDEEYVAGVRCVAAPIRGDDRRPVAALSVSGPALRLTPKRIGALGRRVRQVAARISRELGAPP